MPVVRLKDIAQDLGVSAVTVSKVLRDHPDIGAATKKRVLQRVKELQYRPNLMARGLVTGHTSLIAFVVPDLVDSFFAEIAVTLQYQLRQAGYSMVIAWTANDPEVQMTEIEHLLSLGVDAMVVATAGEDLASFRLLEERDVPYVLLDRNLPELKATFVGADDLLAGRLATAHLLENGCKRVAHLRGEMISTGNLRLQGYEQALEQAGLPVKPRYIAGPIRTGKGSFHDGFEGARKLLEERPRIDGLFCFNDSLAMGAMEAVRAAGLRIPQDLAIIGCGNHPLSGALRLPLSSIDQNTQALGEKSAKAVLAAVLKRRSSRSTVLEPKLLMRASSERAHRKSNRHD